MFEVCKQNLHSGSMRTLRACLLPKISLAAWIGILGAFPVSFAFIKVWESAFHRAVSFDTLSRHYFLPELRLVFFLRDTLRIDWLISLLTSPLLLRQAWQGQDIVASALATYFCVFVWIVVFVVYVWPANHRRLVEVMDPSFKGTLLRAAFFGYGYIAFYTAALYLTASGEVTIGLLDMLLLPVGLCGIGRGFPLDVICFVGNLFILFSIIEIPLYSGLRTIWRRASGEVKPYF